MDLRAPGSILLCLNCIALDRIFLDRADLFDVSEVLIDLVIAFAPFAACLIWMCGSRTMQASMSLDHLATTILI